MNWEFIFWPVLYAALMMVAVMAIAGNAVLIERKVAGWIQGRLGPNRTAPPLLADIPLIGPILVRLGLFQTIADMGKLLFKEEIVPGHVNKFYFFLAPCVALIPALTTMTVLPFGQITLADGAVVPLVLADLDIGILFLFAVASLGVYGTILAGWAANSKYPFLGGIRASAQLISYELAMTFSVLPIFMFAGGTLNLFNVVESQGVWNLFWQPVAALVFLVALFAETNRLPFDMPEAETELVAGYITEYGAFGYGLLMLAEYTHIVIGSAVFTVLFLGGWSLPFVDYPEGIPGAVLSVVVFIGKLSFLIFLFMWIRWTLPRFRYDQVMRLGWKVLLPLAIANLIVYAIGLAAYETWNL